MAQRASRQRESSAVAAALAALAAALLRQSRQAAWQPAFSREAMRLAVETPAGRMAAIAAAQRGDRSQPRLYILPRCSQPEGSESPSQSESERALAALRGAGIDYQREGEPHYGN